MAAEGGRRDGGPGAAKVAHLVRIRARVRARARARAKARVRVWIRVHRPARVGRHRAHVELRAVLG